MRHVALAGQNIRLAIPVQIHNRESMRLRPALINNVLGPRPIRRVWSITNLHPNRGEPTRYYLGDATR